MAKKITIRGIIGLSDKATPEHLESELDAAGGQSISTTFASPGGFVSDGIEMSNMIRDYAGHTSAVITGQAASMASYMPMLFNHVAAYDNTVFMIHNPYGGMVGDYRDSERYTARLKGLRDLLAVAYANKSGKPIEEINQMMDDETFLYGKEIVDQGFADELIESDSGPQNKEEAFALAQTGIQDCQAKMKENESTMAADFEKAAAYLKTEPVNKKTETPAAGGKTNTGEVTKMTLKELLAANPAAKIEHDNLVMLAQSEGATTAKADAEKAWTTAAPILASLDYSPVAKERVIAKARVCDHEGMLDFIALYDQNAENNKAEAAKGEQGEETPGQTTKLEKPGEEGMITGSADDVAAAAKMMREG